MANWNYTHGSTADRDRLRLLLGDHRGTNGAYSGTNQVWSDEELDDCLVMAEDRLPTAAQLAMQNRLSRESLAAGVAGTTDTTGRPEMIQLAMEQLRRLSSEIWTTLEVSTHEPDDLQTHEDLAQPL